MLLPPFSAPPSQLTSLKLNEISKLRFIICNNPKDRYLENRATNVTNVTNAINATTVISVDWQKMVKFFLFLIRTRNLTTKYSPITISKRHFNNNSNSSTKKPYWNLNESKNLHYRLVTQFYHTSLQPGTPGEWASLSAYGWTSTLSSTTGIEARSTSSGSV